MSHVAQIKHLLDFETIDEFPEWDNEESIIELIDDALYAWKVVDESRCDSDCSLWQKIELLFAGADHVGAHVEIGFAG